MQTDVYMNVCLSVCLYVHLWLYLTQYFFEHEMLQTNVIEKIKIFYVQ
jgi:hypothetical protein